MLSDYGYDSVTPALAARWIGRWTAAGAVVALDSRYRLASYRGVTLATPNESEAAAAAGIAIADARDLARAAARLRSLLKVRELVITRGRDGLTLWNRRAGVSLEAHGGHEAVDVTGAGDAVVAAATLALAKGAAPALAAALANVAGSVAVSRRGAVAVSAVDLLRALGTRLPPARAKAVRFRTAGSARSTVAVAGGADRDSRSRPSAARRAPRSR